MRQQPAHAQLLQDAFAGWLAVDVGGAAQHLTETETSPALVAESLACAPHYVGDEPSEAFEYIQMERTVRKAGRVRVSTDDTLALEV